MIRYLLDEASTHLRHLEEQRSQFCSVLMAVVAGILAFGASDSSPHRDLVGYAIVGLGLFGVLLSWRQNEKINYYKSLADSYVQKLLATNSDCSDLVGHQKEVRRVNARRYLWINRLPTGLFWLLLHVAIVLLGSRLVLLALGTTH